MRSRSSQEVAKEKVRPGSASAEQLRLICLLCSCLWKQLPLLSPGSTVCPAEQSPLFSRDHLLENGHETSRTCRNSGKGIVFLCSFALCKALAWQLDLHGAVLLENICFSKEKKEQRLVHSDNFWGIIYYIALKQSSYGSLKESGFTPPPIESRKASTKWGLTIP